MRASIKSSLLAATLAIASISHAQQGQQAPVPGATLDAASQATLDRLSALSVFPTSGWRYHSADIAHGEAVDLDDSSWPLAKTPSNTTGHEAVWYRGRVTVPRTLNGYDLTGARIWLRFDVSANGPMPEILYFDGRRVGLGEDLEQTVLFDHAKPGDSVLVAVKLLHTNDDKRFSGTKMHIDVAANRPSPSDLQTQFVVAQKLLPWVSKDEPKDLATLESAIHAVDVAAIEKADQTAFDASLKKSLALLEPLRPMLQKDTFHLTGNSHIDAAWLWPVTETVDVVRRTFTTALQLMEEYPDYTYTQSAAQYNEWIADKYPAIDAQIKQRIKEGRWEVVGGMWVEPDLNLPDGESQVRSLLLGKRWYKQHYGVDVRIGWNPDSFGYNWQLPQIYKRAGVDYFVTQKMTWNDTNQLPFRLFWWQSPDGSKVLSYFPHDYANDNLDPKRLAEDLAVSRQRAPGLTTMMDLYGIGDHGGGPTRTILDEGEHWAHPASSAEPPVIPQMHFGLAQSFFTASEQQLSANSPVWDYASIAKGYKFPTAEDGKMVIPTWKDEMYFEYHRGVQTSQAQHKRNMRESEERTLNAEKLASLAWLSGDAYPNAQFTDAWKKITFNGFHDLAAGSGIGIIYKDAQKEFDMVRLEDAEAASHALATVAASVKTDSQPGVPILVFNPLAWDRGGIVRVDLQLPDKDTWPSIADAEDHTLPFQVVSFDEAQHLFTVEVETSKTPAMGYQVLHASSKPRSQGLLIISAARAPKTLPILENANLKVVIDPHTGCITSLFNKRTNFEALAPNSCGNQLQAFKDTPKDYDAWNIDYGTLDHPMNIDKADSVKIMENGTGDTIHIERTWQSSHFIQDISLAANADTVVIDNTVDWHENHILLKAAFPLAASGPFATYEIPYGTIQRPTTRNNSWESAQFEVPALRWADLGDGKNGFSLLNEEKYGYDAAGNVLRLSLLRSPTWPDPEADRGIQHFRYALYPHAGTWQQAMTERKGYELNYPLQATVVSAHTGSLPASHSFLSVDDDNVVLTAVKKSEDDDALVLRVFEWAGKSSKASFHLPPGAISATEVNLMEQPIGSAIAIDNDTAILPIGPFEIRSIAVKYPHNAAPLPNTGGM